MKLTYQLRQKIDKYFAEIDPDDLYKLSLEYGFKPINEEQKDKPPFLIFLDIDGVLNHGQFFKARHDYILSLPEDVDPDDKWEIGYTTRHIEKPDLIPDALLDRRFDKPFNMLCHSLNNIDLDALKRFDMVCKATGAKVVISSTWRSNGLEYMQEFFKLLGATFEIIACTGYDQDRIRGVEIRQWLNEYIRENYYKSRYVWFRRYCIIDDDGDMLNWQRDNFIQTDNYTGFTPTCAYKLKNFINSFNL